MKTFTFILIIFILQQASAYDKFDVMVCESMANNSDKDNCLADLKGEYTGKVPTKQAEKAIAQKKTKSVKQTYLQKIDVSPEMQAKRKNAIEKLIRKGVFYKIEIPGSLPRVYVGDLFYMAEIDQKRLFISIVYAYYNTNDPSMDVVGIRDSRTGKEIGTFSEYGLNLY